MIWRGVVLLLVGLSGGAAHAQSTCEGRLERMPGGFEVGGCDLTGANARRVASVCSPGQPCVVKGTTRSCPGVNGACLMMGRISSVSVGASLPACTAANAVDRANEYWQQGNSLLLEGTITAREASTSGPPYGRTEIAMDMVDCEGGSAMAIDHVADRWIGHYVQVHGTAMKGAAGWYIIANDVQAAN